MEIKISDYVSFYRKDNLSMINLKDYPRIPFESMHSISSLDNGMRVRIKDKWYDILSISEAVRKPKNNEGYHFLYIQINWETNEYYIGKVNRKRWSEIKRYQGSGVKFKNKYNAHKSDFCRYFFAFAETNEETERMEAEIVDDVLLGDPKCLNLVRGGGGTNEHNDDEQRKERIRSHMKSHPEQYESMLKRAKELYRSGDTFALKMRNQAIKKTMDNDKYRNMSRERLLKWKNEHPDEYEKSRENNRKAAQSAESKLKRKSSREKWIMEHPEEYKLQQQKLQESRNSVEAKEKRKASLKLWNEMHPDESKENMRKRAAAASKKNSKRVHMCDLKTGNILKTFDSQTVAAQWLVDEGIAKSINCKTSISQVCLNKSCTTGYGTRKQAYGFGWKFAD